MVALEVPVPSGGTGGAQGIWWPQSGHVPVSHALPISLDAQVLGHGASPALP